MSGRATRGCTEGTWRLGCAIYLLWMLCLLLPALAGCALPSKGVAVSRAEEIGDPAADAPLPGNRIVAAYGIAGGVDYNGPASSLATLGAFYPQLYQLGRQYAALDPSHPVILAADLVVNAIQHCSAYPRYCSSWTDAATIQAYINYCKRHHMLLFLDLQLGTEPVQEAVLKHALTYLERYAFVELALDTEFHFPNTAAGHAEASGYPCCLGWMSAAEINWTLAELSQISLQHDLPSKVLLVHQWNGAVLPDKAKIHAHPGVALVLESDGFGAYDNKIGDYKVFVQRHLLEYGGYKLFYFYGDGSTAYDYDDDGAVRVQGPEQVMRLIPQPLFISYQ